MTAVQYARCAPDWAPSTAPLPILRVGAGRHRAPGGRVARYRRRLALRARQHATATALYAVVHLGLTGARP